MRTQTLTAVVAALALSACSFTGPPIGEVIDPSVDAGAGTADADVDSMISSVDAAITIADGSVARTLTETAPDVATEQGAACTAGPGGAIYDGRWYRVFPLGDPFFGVAGAFTVTGVNFSAWKAQAASGVQIQIGTYSGNAPSSTFQPSMFTSIATRSTTLADANGGALVHVALASPLQFSAGAKIAVEISAASGLEIGSIGASSWTDGFFGSAMCGYTAVASHGFVVTIDGHE